MPKILIVEDDPNIRNAYSSVCKKNNWDYQTANNGAEALEKLQTYKPDLIILDVLMPIMTGVDFMENVKKQNLALPPTIAMTNSQVPENTGERLKGLGAKTYRLKVDVGLDDLAELVKKYLNL